ncbi:MAG: cupredoxin domain-containing protein [Dehalococcoidia bacterium]|nr:cupredoxin domain-containing protein [Dehalococcoidia bacterium]
MSNKKRLTVVLTAVAGLSIFLAGCSSSDEETTDATATTEAAAATATAAAATATAEGTAAAPAAAVSVALEFADIKYSVTELTATVGQPLEIAMTNAGVLEHDFSIDEIEGEATVDGASAESGDWDVHVSLAPGGAATLMLTPTKAGTYEFYCSVLGHKEAGMKGTLTVQ